MPDEYNKRSLPPSKEIERKANQDATSSQDVRAVKIVERNIVQSQSATRGKKKKKKNLAGGRVVAPSAAERITSHALCDALPIPHTPPFAALHAPPDLLKKLRDPL